MGKQIGQSVNFAMRTSIWPYPSHAGLTRLVSSSRRCTSVRAYATSPPTLAIRRASASKAGGNFTVVGVPQDAAQLIRHHENTDYDE